LIPVILSGGSGTRLWPLSRQKMPKQFCDIFGKPLQTLTLERAHKLGSPWIITSEALRTLTEANLQQMVSPQKVHVVYEPMGRNTAPAIASLCHLLQMQGHGDEIAGVFPSDHLISKEEEFLKVVNFAISVARKNKVVTLGIKPSYPETGYGYIQTEEQSFSEIAALRAFPVVKFHEKPELSKAQGFLSQGGFSWNAGIFIFKVSHMAELFAQHQPEMWRQVQDIKSDESNLKDVYSRLTSISVDYAIMEKLTGQELICIPADFGWSDVGSWDAVASLRRSQEILSVNADQNFVFSQEKKHYSMIGLQDVILVDTKDALLLLKRGQSQDVKLVVDALTKAQSSLIRDHVFEYRPWGHFEILKETDNFKSKVIYLNPHSQISYQSHAKREEHWTIVRGQGEVVLNDRVLPVQAGSHVHIPLGAKHRIRNTTSDELEFVEVQLGSYFGEDDIVRYEDDYQRG
jgi:mannose-1-phosphate guanylyltransferase/mannose-6-phosphate isomerase